MSYDNPNMAITRQGMTVTEAARHFIGIAYELPKHAVGILCN